MKDWNWYGLVAAIIAVSLGATLLIGVGGAVVAGRAISDKGGEVLVGIFAILGGALTAIIATRKNGPPQ